MALGKTVGDLSEEISDAELQEWMVFYRLEPFGEERADLRAGIVAATIANANRGKRRQAFKPTDFMPYAKLKAERQRWKGAPKGRALGKKVIEIFRGMAAKQKG